ncbi:MAG: NINE protein [Bacteroidota bacterium]
MKKKGVAFVLAFFLGIFGTHRFYLGQRKLGLLYLAIFIVGFLHITMTYTWHGPPLFIITAIIAFVDSILLLAMPKAEFDEKYNKNKLSYQTSVSDTDQRATGRTYRRTTRQRQLTFKSANPFKTSGLEKYREYDYEGAIEDFKQALEVKYQDPAVHFNLACAYSIMEETEQSFFHLDKAVSFGFNDFDKIQSHDALAYIRTSDTFDQFVANNYQITPKVEPPKADLLSTPTPLMDVDILEKIASLGELRDKGFLTEDEFAMQKKRLLEMK